MAKFDNRATLAQLGRKYDERMAAFKRKLAGVEEQPSDPAQADALVGLLKAVLQKLESMDSGQPDSQ